MPYPEGICSRQEHADDDLAVCVEIVVYFAMYSGLQGEAIEWTRAWTGRLRMTLIAASHMEIVHANAIPRYLLHDIDRSSKRRANVHCLVCPGHRSQTKSPPDIGSDLGIKVGSSFPPHAGSINVGRRLIVWLGEHAHDTDEDLLNALNR